jgi:glutathione S-transferase
MIKVWGRASSSNVQALMWVIGELDLPYERYDVGFTHGGNNTPDFLKMNPNGTVPVLQDGDGTPIWETGAILRYLASKYADDSFWPADAEERAVVDKWAEWAKLNIAVNFTVPIFWRVARTAPLKRNTEAIRQAVSNLEGFLAVAEAQLAKHAFLATSNFSLADIQLGHLLYRYFEIDIQRSNFPNIETYYRRLNERTAFKEHVAISYEELRVLD